MTQLLALELMAGVGEPDERKFDHGRDAMHLRRPCNAAEIADLFARGNFAKGLDERVWD